MSTRTDKIKEKSKYTLADLCEIVSILRDEREGCDWDKKQTHESLRHNLIEETYEAVEAINKKDESLLCEELGDILLQIVFHSQIKSEEGKFTIDEVIDGISRKMVYRHPHIFSDFKGDIVEEWEKLKNKEKNRKSEKEIFDSVPRELPALIRAEKIYKKSKRDSRGSEGERDFYEHIKANLKDMDEKEREAFSGKLLFDIVSILGDFGVNAEESLTYATDSFIDNCLKEKSEGDSANL
jgi:tetrapyrrole methylase family protein/MazG family protein